MAELGIDISGQESKTLERFLDQQFDAVITVCDLANEACPVFFGAKERLHWSFPDPSKGEGDDEQQLAVYPRCATTFATTSSENYSQGCPRELSERLPATRHPGGTTWPSSHDPHRQPRQQPARVQVAGVPVGTHQGDDVHEQR